MLSVIRSLQELKFGQLMQVYDECNRENGGEFYPELPQNQQILQAEQDFYQYLRECFFRTEGAFYAVWEENGSYVCALRMEPYQDGMLLEALETAPEHRKRGYAASLISAVLKLPEMPKVYAHVHKKNTASLRTHASCGFQRILEHALYIDGSVRSHSCTLCYEKTTH